MLNYMSYSQRQTGPDFNANVFYWKIINNGKTEEFKTLHFLKVT